MSLEPGTFRYHQTRTVYLVTYSQADVEKKGNRKTFADIDTDAFNKNKLFNCVEYWCCAKERQGKGPPLPPGKTDRCVQVETS